MWRILVFSVFLTFLSCNDGEITVDNFDFSNSTTQACYNGTPNFFMYRISNSEVLFIRMPESHLDNPITPAISPRELTPLNVEAANVDVIYRIYNGNLTPNIICNPIPPQTPIVIEQWLASSGLINFTTNVSKENITYMGSQNATRVRGYNHEIQFQNITFNRPNGIQQFYQSLPYGSFQTNLVNPFPNFTGPIRLCNDGSDRILLYKNVGNQILQINLPTSLFANENTNNTPRTALINDTNVMRYIVFNTVVPVNNNAYCTATLTELESWRGRNGTANTNGIIEVETVQDSEGFRHTVTLKRVILERGQVDFTLGDAWIMGSFYL